MAPRRSTVLGAAGAAPRPFLRWAGGKRKLVTLLLEFVPEDVLDRQYREPFVGAGALFFALRPRSATISDANDHLIMCYEYVRDRPDLVHRYLVHHAARTSERYYYAVRSDYTQSGPSAAQAARLIYLNSACFNGIFRVNKRGEFNVPYGRKEPPVLPTRAALRTASCSLRSAAIRVSDYRKALADAESGDFVYLDPPYPPLNGTAYFTHYTPDRFGEGDQRRLAVAFRELHERGCLLMMSNADTELIRKLYDAFTIDELSVTRYVTCKRRKHRVKELVITNY